MLDTLPDTTGTRTLPTEEDFVVHDRRTCDCELTYVHRKRHAALGVGIDIKLCCMAKAIEEWMGVPAGTFYQVFEFEPTWVWDCAEIQTKRRVLPNGITEIIGHEVGPPPEWLLKRFKERGIEVKNLPS